jgi:hypothetical protein
MPPTTTLERAAAPAPHAPAPHAPAAEPEAEVLEIVDDGCAVIGRELRGEIHRRGLLHRAVYVWVFDGAGRLLIQRRAWEKKIGPGQWDLSAAEHLSIGEAGLALGFMGLGYRLAGRLVSVRREFRCLVPLTTPHHTALPTTNRTHTNLPTSHPTRQARPSTRRPSEGSKRS